MEQRNKADASAITRNYLDSILIKERLINSDIADLSFSLWGETFSTPIMMPAFSHLNKFIEGQGSPMAAYSQAARNLNALNFVGMLENQELDALLATGAKTVRIIKPYADRKKVFDQIAYAKEKGAFAVGMDIDHIFGHDGKYDVVEGEDMTKQTKEDIRSYVEASDLPFVVKGVLSAEDALVCQECGVKAILVSHHHGRMPFAAPPLMVLPEITEALGPGREMKIFVDCGIDRGADAFKALALGADAVAVGRALLPDLMKNGAAGVENYVTKMNEELRMIMGFTGFSKVEEINSSVLMQTIMLK